MKDSEIKILKQCPLFVGMCEEELDTVLDCLQARPASFAKGEYIHRRGDSIDTIGIVMSGSVHVVMEDYWGNRNILGNAGVGQMFGESYACMAHEASRVDVIAAQKTEVLFVEGRRVVTTCSSACAFHTKLIKNLLTVLARKNSALTDKVAHVTKRSLREKILSYLSSVSQEKGSATFDIPFNRQQLADYLAVERSALSAMLGKLRDEGLISFEKNHFELH